MTQKELAKAARRMVLEADPWELGQLTVNEIARRLMVNRSTLSRAFTAYYPWITLRRLLEIKKIRMFESLVFFLEVKTVKEALDIMDIRNASHFIKRYKAFRNRTPGETIKQRREELKERGQEWAPVYRFCDIIRGRKRRL